MNTQDIQIIQEVDELEEPQKYYTALQRLIDDGQAWNLEGFYGRNMDTSGTKPNWNIKTVSNWQKLSAVFEK